jgi:hypothetical protein
MQVKDMTIEELKLLIQETVAETIQSGERGIPAQEVAKNLGLTW